jgi:UDP-glucose 4-epimerase
MRVLVTGATGFIGRHLIRRLVQAGHSVTALILETPDQESPFPSSMADIRSSLDIAHGDLRNHRLTTQVVRDSDPDCVFHLAAAGVTDPFLNVDTAVRHNVNGTLNLLRACYESQATSQPPNQIIVARTPGEREAINVYAATKAAAWKLCRMYARTQDWPILGAMLFQVFGPEQPRRTLVQAASRAALSGQDFPMTSGDQCRDWIFVDDVVDGLICVMNQTLPPGTTVELGTGKLTSVAVAVRRIYEIVGRGGVPLIGALPDRIGEDPQQVANAAQTKTQIGWQAKTSLDDGLRQLLNSLSP